MNVSIYIHLYIFIYIYICMYVCMHVIVVSITRNKEPCKEHISSPIPSIS